MIQFLAFFFGMFLLAYIINVCGDAIDKARATHDEALADRIVEKIKEHQGLI